MDLLAGFRAMVAPAPTLLQREATYDSLVEALYDIIDERSASFTLQQALKLPPVIRGVSLIAGVGASMLPLLYQGGQAAAVQPRIVRKPDPFETRYRFVYQTLEQFVATEYGDAFWLLTDHDERGYPRAATVLPHEDVRVEWDERRWGRRYWWRDKPMVPDVDIKHIAPNRRPGQLRGHGPIHDSLTYLQAIHEAEEFASGFFSSGGMPSTLLKVAATMTQAQATQLQTQWVEHRTDPSLPAVASGGMDVEFPGADPEKSQMQQSRGAGAAIVARILGIPGALLHVETSGATITYTNPAGALEELLKTTVAPLYLAPLEQAWSELVPGTQSVRFDLADMQRADIGARFAVYGQGIDKGFMSPEEARAFEGWGPMPATEPGQAFTPEPVPEPVTIEVPT